MTEVCQPCRPHHVHPKCSGCTFLGTLTHTQNELTRDYDLYVCDPYKEGTTVIARYGEDDKYLSSLIELVVPESQTPLFEAMKRTFAMMGPSNVV